MSKPRPTKNYPNAKRTTKPSKPQKSKSENLQIERLERNINQKLKAMSQKLDTSKDSVAVQKANLVVNALRFLWEFLRGLVS
jgi:septin family protein